MDSKHQGWVCPCSVFLYIEALSGLPRLHYSELPYMALLTMINVLPVE